MDTAFIFGFFCGVGLALCIRFVSVWQKQKSYAKEYEAWISRQQSSTRTATKGTPATPDISWVPKDRQ